MNVKKGGKTMEKKKDSDVSFMEEDQKEHFDLVVSKRRFPIVKEYLKGLEARKYIIAINQLTYFYKFFETRFEIKRGDVFLARFGMGCGNELSGNHYVAALLDSDSINQVVTVVPLKSTKGNPMNPASDILLGKIKGLENGKEAVAIINQIKTIDKRRLFNPETIAKLSYYQRSEVIGEYSEIECQIKAKYRLTDEQDKKVHKAIREYIINGYIKHS